MDKIIHKAAQLKCCPQRAFDLFSTKNCLESWLSIQAEVDVVAGGKYELFWDPKCKEDNSTLGCRITAIEPTQFLSFEWRSPNCFKHFANEADPLTHVVVFFIPTHEGTNIHLIHSGWRSSKEWEDARLWQERAWSVAFEKLVSYSNEYST